MNKMSIQSRCKMSRSDSRPKGAIHRSFQGLGEKRAVEGRVQLLLRLPPNLTIPDHRTRKALIDAIAARGFCGAPSVFFPGVHNEAKRYTKDGKRFCWVFLPISILCTAIPVVANTFSLKWEERMHEIEIIVAKKTITGK